MGRKIFVVALVLALLILLPVFSFADLPSDYTELEYIESTGTQYIDTGFIPDSDTKVVFDFDQSITGNQVLFGARSGAESRAYGVGWMTTIYYRIYYGDGYSNFSAGPESPIGRKTITQNKNVLTIDDYTFSRFSSSFSCLYNLYLFCVNTADTASLFTSGKLYSCQIYDDGTLVRDFIPCANASNEVGLWDDVNSRFYGNSGTGSFIAGPVVTPPVPEYSISVSSDGNGFASSDLSTAAAGTTVTLSATPDENYVFSEWQVLEGDISIVNNQFIMPESDVSVKAVFAPDGTHSVTVENDGFGTGSANPVRAEAGTTVTLTAVPVLGYEFDSWEVVSGSVNISSNQFIMPDSDVVVKANFKPVVYTITLNQGSNGSATVSQTTGIIGDVVTLTATPDELYSFSHWEVFPATVSITDNQFTMPAANVTLTPVFIEQTAISSGFEYHSGILDSESASEYFLIDVSFGEQPAGEYLINIYHWGNGYIPNFQIYIGDKYLPIVSSGSVASVAIEHDGGELVLDGSASFIRSTVGVADGSVFVTSGVGTIYFDKPLSWTFNIEDVVLIPADLANVEDYGMFSTIISFLKGQFEDLISVFGSEEAEEDVNEAQESLNQEIEEVNQLSSDLTEQTANLEQQMTTDFSVSDEVTGQTESVQLIYTGLFSSLGLFSIFIWLPVLFAVIKHLLRL